MKQLDRKEQSVPVRYIMYLETNHSTQARPAEVEIERQRQQLEELAANGSLIVVDQISDVHSGPDFHPGFERVLRLIAKGQADGILCVSLEKVGRRAMDIVYAAMAVSSGRIRSIRTLEKDYTASSKGPKVSLPNLPQTLGA